MLYTKSENGEMTPITYGNTYAKCPKCGTFHQVDLAETMECAGGDIEEVDAYCEECSKAHTPLWEHMDEVEFVASLFPGTDVETVKGIVQSGLDNGFSFDTALVGAKLALAMQTGREQLFTLDEVASAMGCTTEAVETEMEQLGISPIKASTLPGFEWLLREE